MKNADFAELYRCVSEGETSYLRVDAEGEIYTRKFAPEHRLIVLGGGHISQAICRIASLIEFDVTVVDDRPAFANKARFPEASQVICDDFKKAIRDLRIRESDFVCVVTRGHRHDADCLRQILPGKLPAYLGMIGSRRRVSELFDLLEEEGFARSILDYIHSPIGLKIHAVTPAEIAVSIAAELIAVRSEAAKADPFEVLEQTNIDPDTLQYLAENPEPKAFLLVIRSTGSTPVKPGSYMAVNSLGQPHGTIGGGCSESAVMGDARKLIGTGGQRIIEVDMTNDVAEDEGMVCGGKMSVLVEDVTE